MHVSLALLICFTKFSLYFHVRGELPEESDFTPTCAYALWDKHKINVITVERNENETGPSYEIPSDYAAVALFQNKINETGWGFLMIQTNQRYEDEVQAYSAGFLEAMLTHDLVFMHWTNTLNNFCADKVETCQKVQRYLKRNLKWIHGMISRYNSSQPYWYQVNLIFQQLKGFADGYTRAIKRDVSKILSFYDLLWMNIQGDLEDLVAAFDSDNPNIREPSIVPGSGSCAALIKIIPNTFDLYTAHSTCSSYQSMLRLQKKYIFPFRVLGNTSRVIPGFAMSFSSYPGQIQSGDDFYITSEKLTILRTTTGNNNHSMYQHVVPERQMLAQFRAVIAGRLADCGRCWCKLFSQYNSGTCNSQWMVVDYKLFEIQARTSELSKHLLWVLEQLPGYIRYEDNTHILNEQSYWPSYSIPYFSDIFKLGGNAKLVEQYGSWFTYENNPRALIFRRDHRGVVNAARMMSFMRSNNYTQDSLSRCNCTPGHNAALAVAPRGDLNPVDGRYPLASLGFRLQGATDMKLTTANLVSSFQFIAYAGPAYNKNIPPFTWTSVPSEHAKHLGQPDMWQFGPVLHRWDWN